MCFKTKLTFTLRPSQRLMALIATLLLIVLVRETCVWLMQLVAHPELGNLLGLFLLLGGLMLWRKFRPLSPQLIEANARLMKESAFAFLPVSAGSLLMLFHLGDELPWLLGIMVLSTLLALWVYAHIARRWL